MQKRWNKYVMETQPINTKKALDEFIFYKRSENLAESTLNTYRQHIQRFLDDSAPVGYFSTDSLTQKDYQYFCQELQADTSKNDVTVQSYCRSVRTFLNWLMDNQYTEPFEIKLPKAQQTIKETYTDEEMKILLQKPKTPTPQKTYYTWVFINLIAATGLRLSSAMDLKVRNIDFDEGKIYVNRTKSKKALTIPIASNKDILKILKTYIRKFNLKKDDYLFSRADGGRLANHTMQTNVIQYNRERGVEKTSIHLFRHTFAKDFYTQTKDLFTLQQILGHADISTTQRYIQSLGVSLFEDANYNPQQKYSNYANAQKRRRGTVK